MYVLTLVAPERLLPGDVSAASDALRAAGAEVGAVSWIDIDRAVDIAFKHLSAADGRAAAESLGLGADVFAQASGQREKRLLIADMDSTMITVECIDELADYAGLKAEVAEITERAMQGELDFEAALDARVALLAGLDAEVIDRCREERVTLTPGAATLVRTMRAQGAACLLVSGGFTRFAGPVAEAIGFNRAVANELLIEDGKLTGKVRRPIVGAAAKHDALTETMAQLSLERAETMAVGDGANDIPMIEAAGLGVAYRAKPAAAAAADARIVHNDLTALLYAQGIPRAQWVTA